MPSPRSERGQATVDYVTLIAILALALCASAAVAGGGAPNVANAVLGQVHRALCVVTGRSCPAEPQLPCVVASDRDAVRVAVSIAILRVDKDRAVMRERMSDGTVRLTLSQRSGAGVEVDIGARAEVKLRGRTLGFERDVHVGAGGVLGYGEVFVATDDREADAIMRELRRPRLPIIGPGTKPREVFVEGGVRALGRLGIGAIAAGVSLEGLAEGIIGAHRDMRSGEVTISLSAGASGWGLLSALMVGTSRSSDRQVGLDLTLDRHGRPIALSLRASGNLVAGAQLMPTFPVGQGVDLSQAFRAGMDGQRWELGARLDLADPEVAAAWAAFRHDRENPAAVRALAARLREQAHLDVRTYAVRSESVSGAVEIALAVKAGGEIERSSERARLLSAASRPPGGLWEQRIDCVAA